MADRDPGRVSADVDWREVARLVLTSRELDRIEEQELVPAKKVLYQFSARGHDMAQVLLGLQLKDGDAACGYYRSRPLLLALGVPLADALGSGMGLAGGYSDGRDIGVVFNYPNPGGAHALPMCGGVGAQYTPAAGWAQAIAYKQRFWKRDRKTRLSLVLGGDASCATGGFWSALTIATTQQLPLLFFIEDNGYGISVPSEYQTPGKDIAANLASFSGLTIFSGDGTDPVAASRLIHEAVGHVRDQAGARASAPDRAAARRAQLPGHADLQERGRDRGRMGARPAAQAQGAFREAADRRGSLGGSRARSRLAGRGGACRSRGARRIVAGGRDQERLLRRRIAGSGRRRGPGPDGDDRSAASRWPAHQHGHRHPPRARSGARSQPAGAGIRRGRRTQGRRPRGDARPAGQISGAIECSTRP